MNELTTPLTLPHVTTPAELFVTVGLISERGFEMDSLPLGLSATAHSAYREFTTLATIRGAWNRKTEKSLVSALREQVRTGKLAPRAMRIADQVIGCLTQHELAVILERMKRFGELMANETPETLAACRASPQIDLRARQVVDEVARIPSEIAA